LDACCKSVSAWNKLRNGPWYWGGCRVFAGVELAGEGLFDPQARGGRPSGGAGPAVEDWRSRFRCFRDRVIRFEDRGIHFEDRGIHFEDLGIPFQTRSRGTYFHTERSRFKLRTDILGHVPGGHGGGEAGWYLEVQVLGRQDFEWAALVVDSPGSGGGRLVFGPHSRVVWFLREVPVDAACLVVRHLADMRGPFTKQSLGLYVRGGNIAFFRRCSLGAASFHGAADGAAAAAASAETAWETTGFVADFSWVKSCHLSLRVLSAGSNERSVRIARFGAVPPVAVQRNERAYDSANWR